MSVVSASIRPLQQPLIERDHADRFDTRLPVVWQVRLHTLDLAITIHSKLFLMFMVNSKIFSPLMVRKANLGIRA